MGVPIAERWFELRRVDAGVTHLFEPHVAPLLRCNVWHVRGRDRDLLVDSGLGVASLRDAARELFERPLAAVATHAHYDHVGSLHEFETRIAHPRAAAEIARGDGFASLRAADFGADLLRLFAAAGYEIPDELVDAYPHAGFDPASYRLVPTRLTRLVEEGDVIDLGDRAFEVLHLPGHTPGCIGLFERASGVLFSGDAIYDGPLLDMLPESDVEAYRRTMRRLRELPVSVVHAGHEPSFGRARLVELTDAYLRASGV
jgi:glyoxylase-like metal-dependent hydrolase (beta-lactamase superfamily II)